MHLEFHSKQNRICWLLNHTTLMEAEVPMLLKMGFEVFVPKQISQSMECRTASVDFQYDHSLSISRSDLNLLNQFNFYGEQWNAEIHSCLNRNFGTTITPCVIPTLYNMARFFSGEIYVRVFGVAGTLNYEALTDCALEQIDKLESLSDRIAPNSWRSRLQSLRSDFGARQILQHRNALMKWLFRAKDRLHLAASYTQIISNELRFFRERALHLPLGFGQSLLNQQNSWTGGNGRVCFVCPNVNQNMYYRLIYENFVKHFSELPYYIAGRQDLGAHQLDNQIDDPSILGFQIRSEYDRLLKQCEVMFYHSREPRHLHYHPLEAILFGLPLIFLEGGILCELGGQDLPGMCRDEQEAKNKMSRLLSGDEELRMQIVKSQPAMLREFSDDFVRETWRKNFPMRRRAQVIAA